jgi:hypothetical protein
MLSRRATAKGKRSALRIDSVPRIKRSGGGRGEEEKEIKRRVHTTVKGKERRKREAPEGDEKRVCEGVVLYRMCFYSHCYDYTVTLIVK